MPFAGGTTTGGHIPTGNARMNGLYLRKGYIVILIPWEKGVLFVMYIEMDS